MPVELDLRIHAGHRWCPGEIQIGKVFRFETRLRSLASLVENGSRHRYRKLGDVGGSLRIRYFRLACEYGAQAVEGKDRMRRSAVVVPFEGGQRLGVGSNHRDLPEGRLEWQE